MGGPSAALAPLTGDLKYDLRGASPAYAGRKRPASNALAPPARGGPIDAIPGVACGEICAIRPRLLECFTKRVALECI